jgi:perosamine synthetase
MYCGEMGRSPAKLFTDWLSGGTAPSIPQMTGRSVTFTQSGRSAILLAARMWNIGEKDEVLVPSYNCGSEISPFIAMGARVSMYRIDSKAQIDLADLRRRVTERTKLIQAIHYFGYPAELGDLASFCRERNIKLLEDCALSLFTNETGRLGDAAIFSFYKTLPTCAGGALVLQDPLALRNCALQTSALPQTMHGVLSLTKKWAGASLNLSPTTSSRTYSGQEPSDKYDSSLPDIPADYYCEKDAIVHRGSRIPLGLLKCTDIEGVVRRRQENYNLLRQLLSDSDGLSILWNERIADRDVCPLGLPVLVRNKSQWCKSLNAAGIVVSPWWVGCHRGLNWHEFPEALSLKAQLILLPVHQHLDARHMEYIAHQVHSLASIIE